MSQTDQDKATAAHGKIIARAWRDPAFKAKLMADPHATLKEAGVAVPEGVTVKVVENTDTHHHLVLPPKPTGELSDAELEKVAGGWSLVLCRPAYIGRLWCGRLLICSKWHRVSSLTSLTSSTTNFLAL